jgi:hypothetical protein
MNKIDLDALKKIIVAPGAMSYRFINGRQIPLLTPITIFLIANIMAFAEPAHSDLYAQMNNMPYSTVAREMVEKKIRKNKTSLKRFEPVYETRSWWMSRALLVLTVLYFSLALFVINYRKTLRYVDHLVVSFEFMTLATLYIFVILGWIHVLILGLMVAAVLLYAFEQNAYRQRTFRAVTNAALLVFCFYAVLLAYRASVFFITILTL